MAEMPNIFKEYCCVLGRARRAESKHSVVKAPTIAGLFGDLGSGGLYSYVEGEVRI